MDKNIKRYNISADIIRFIAIVFVVILHTFSYFQSKTTLAGFNWWVAITVESVTKVAVPLFIMLSGLLILDRNKKYINSFQFYKKRVSKIGIPLIFWSIFYYISFTILTGKTLTIKGFFYNFIFLNIFYHLYFLFIIAGLYIITPILKAYLYKIYNSEKAIAIAILFIYSIIMIILAYVIPAKFSFWSIFTVFIPFIAYYLAGNYLHLIKVSKKRYVLMAKLYFLTLIITIIIKYYAWIISINNHNPFIMRYFSDALSINVVALSILSFILLLNSKKLSGLLRYKVIRKLILGISHYSLGIYLIHPILLYILNKLIELDSSYPLTPLFLLLKSFLIISISYVTVKLCSKIRYINLLFG